MSLRIDFDHEFQYKFINGLFLPALNVTLIGPAGEQDLIGILDTGASYCLLNGRRARRIGLDLTAGRREILWGLTGQIISWAHPVHLEIFGTRFACEVAFSEHDIPRELLGRHTLFPQIRLAFREGLSIGYFHPAP